MKTSAKSRGIITAGLFAALIFLATRVFQFPTAHGGYIHPGDTIIYLAAGLMPLPFAAPAAAIGAALSDLLSPGGAVYAIPTLIIKAVMTLFFTSKYNTIICRRNIIALFAAGIFGLLAYAIFSGFMYGNFIAPLLELPIDMLQPIASGILFVILGTAFDKMKIKQRFDFSFKK